jgi:hypothetical protein
MMASDRESSARLIDLAAVVVSPALVMLMVGSLTFFLITVLYQGAYPDRLLYTFFFFVFGAVLIARISIQFGRARAWLYAAALGGACFLAMMAYVDYPPGLMKALGPLLNLGLMALVWWSADKLTWDCTHFDEDRKASGKGVLAAAGLDEETEDGEQESEEEEASRERQRPEARRGKKKPVGWLEKFQAYREAQRKKAHTPGVWVLYFSLAALPLFALGQSLIDPEDTATRRATLLQMAVYVGSGLGLLVTTTLFGLKRYLEQRGARIPPVMVGGWLGLGAGLIVVFLVVGMALPRPHSETPWFGMKRAKTGDREASRYAQVKDGSAGKGDGAAGDKTQAGDGKNSAKGGKEGGGKSGEKGSDGGQGKSQGGQQKGGENGSGKGDQTGQGQDQGKDQSGQKGQKGEDRESRSGSKSSKQDEGSDAGRQASRNGDESRDASGDSARGSDSESSGPSRFAEALEKFGSFVKWVVWIIVAAAVVIGIVIFILKFLAPFTDWARNLLDWLKGLFARKANPERLRATGEVDAEEVIERPPPFSTFRNPFADGTARRRDPAELVEYTFAALDAWTWDRGRGREPGETPMEFAVRVGHEYAELDEPGFRLANLYARLLYSRHPLPGNTLAVLKEFWDSLESAPVGPA